MPNLVGIVQVTTPGHTSGIDRVEPSPVSVKHGPANPVSHMIKKPRKYDSRIHCSFLMYQRDWTDSSKCSGNG